MATNAKAAAAATKGQGTCVACGHAKDMHTDGNSVKCREYLCPCDTYWTRHPDQQWLSTKWAGRATQPQSGS